MQGWHLVSEYGCYACHEINGYGASRRIGPDMRLEPNYFAAASALRADPAFSDLEPELRQDVETLVHHPDVPLYLSIQISHELREG